MIGLCLKAGRATVLFLTVVLLALVALADWSVGNSVSLSVLYILPMMLGAVVLRPWETAGLALLCAFLRACFDVPASHAEIVLRFAFASLAYFSSGLFVTALVRNRELVVESLAKVQHEEELRREAEEQLALLVESSPAGILTLDQTGTVLAANRAANTLFAIPDGQTLQGRSINAYLPLLSDALRVEIGPEAFRTAAQCQGHRQSGEIFLAHTWFSSYTAHEGLRLAAIIVDSSEEMRDREEQNFHQLVRYNRIAAAAISHEVRNMCGAISLACSNLREKRGLAMDEDYIGLANLVRGLERLSSFELQSRASETIEEVSLQAVLDNLRIMIEPDWREIGAVVEWQVPRNVPNVAGQSNGLLQAFLNLAQNSHRAVQEMPSRELRIAVSAKSRTALVSFEDSGPGIAAPERLFQPFQSGADGTGLGLYISRAIVRSYGGDLRFESRPQGSCFVVELQIVEAVRLE